MIVVRRRAAPGATPAPEAAPAVRSGPVRRVPAKGPGSLREALRAALPPKEAGERNTDGSSFQDTVKRYKAKIRNPMTAIRANCVECSGGSLKEVADCRVTKCSLYPFRMGVNPLHKRTKARLDGGAGEDDHDHGDEDDTTDGE